MEGRNDENLQISWRDRSDRHRKRIACQLCCRIHADTSVTDIGAANHSPADSPVFTLAPATYADQRTIAAFARGNARTIRRAPHVDGDDAR
jgi:hypothetical protein